MRYILYEIRHMIDATVVFCPTKSTADMFRSLIPREFIYQEASLDALERILKFQRDGNGCASEKGEVYASS